MNPTRSWVFGVAGNLQFTYWFWAFCGWKCFLVTLFYFVIFVCFAFFFKFLLNPSTKDDYPKTSSRLLIFVRAYWNSYRKIRVKIDKVWRIFRAWFIDRSSPVRCNQKANNWIMICSYAFFSTSRRLGVAPFITYIPEKLLNADWLRQTAFFS